MPRDAHPALGADDCLGVLTEQAIGKIFIAGILPGLLLVAFYCAYIFWVAITAPHRVGAGRDARAPESDPGEAGFLAQLASTLLVVALIVGILGGIWLGAFTPTEGAGVGAAASLALAMLKGMRAKALFEVILSVGRTSAPLLLLLFCAQLYSRVLSMTGITGMAKEFFVTSGLGQWGVLAVMVGTWFVLGCIIDSISIILLTVPVFGPVAMAMGFDPLAFAILGILAIETGLLTPPFGILVFTVRASLGSEGMTLAEIFRGAIPYWICLLVVLAVIAAFPRIASWLPQVGLALGR